MKRSAHQRSQNVTSTLMRCSVIRNGVTARVLLTTHCDGSTGRGPCVQYTTCRRLDFRHLPRFSFYLVSRIISGSTSDAGVPGPSRLPPAVVIRNATFLSDHISMVLGLDQVRESPATTEVHVPRLGTKMRRMEGARYLGNPDSVRLLCLHLPCCWRRQHSAATQSRRVSLHPE